MLGRRRGFGSLGEYRHSARGATLEKDREKSKEKMVKTWKDVKRILKNVVVCVCEGRERIDYCNVENGYINHNVIC